MALLLPVIITEVDFQFSVCNESFLVFGKNQQKTFRVFVKITRISFAIFGNYAYNMLISKGETETNGTGEKDLS